jgi:flagellar biosynthesis/type III secretory pathway protein FliH
MIVNEARSKAQVEGDRMITIARETINNEKMAAITELKNQVATLSIEIAEKVIRQQSNDDKQKALVQEMLNDKETKGVTKYENIPRSYENTKYELTNQRSRMLIDEYYEIIMPGV